jgi:hypothetical protein
MTKRKIVGPDAQDILRAAHAMVANHGERASNVARMRARNLAENALEARLVWDRIFRTIQQIQPSPGRIAV